MELTGHFTYHTFKKKLSLSYWNGLLKSQLKHQLRGHTLGYNICINSVIFLCGSMSLSGIIHRSGNQGLEAEVTLLTIINPNGPLGSFLLTVPTRLGSFSLVVLILKEVTIDWDTAWIPLNYELWLHPGNFGFLVSKE